MTVEVKAALKRNWLAFCSRGYLSGEWRVAQLMEWMKFTVAVICSQLMWHLWGFYLTKQEGQNAQFQKNIVLSVQITGSSPQERVICLYGIWREFAHSEQALFDMPWMDQLGTPSHSLQNWLSLALQNYTAPKKQQPGTKTAILQCFWQQIYMPKASPWVDCELSEDPPNMTEKVLASSCSNTSPYVP